MLWVLIADRALEASGERRSVLRAEGEHFVIDAVGEDDLVSREFRSGNWRSGAVSGWLRFNEALPIAPLADVVMWIGLRPCLDPSVNLRGDNLDQFASAFSEFLDPLPLPLDFLIALNVVGAH